jgi:hypothetical protein
MKKLLEFITDPSSKELSASRLCLLLVIVILVPTMVYLVGKNIWPAKEAVSLLTSALASLAGIYGLNSAAGAWSKRKFEIKEEVDVYEKKSKHLQELNDEVK